MNTNVLVYESDEYCSDFPPTNLQEFVLFFNEMLRNIPEQYKDSAEIEVSSEGYYGESPYAAIKVSYERPETEEEKKEREKRERSQKLSQKERELAELERSKKKYESFDDQSCLE